MKRQSLEKLPFTVTVPDGTPPGEYVAGFLAQLETDNTSDESINPGSGSSFSVKVIPQVGVAVIIHVPGEEYCNPVVESLEPIIQTGKLNLHLELNNAGNTAFKGKGMLTMTNKASSLVVEEIPLGYGYTIAGTTLKAEIITELPQEGEYLINIKLQDTSQTDCEIDFEKTLSIGEDEITKVNQQATAIVESILQATSVPVVNIESSTSPVQQVQQFPVWILWLAAIVFLIGLSMTIYAAAVLKKRK